MLSALFFGRDNPIAGHQDQHSQVESKKPFGDQIEFWKFISMEEKRNIDSSNNSNYSIK